MKKYTTEQRKILLSFLEDNPDQQFSVEEIADKVCSDEGISVSSVYRNINAMVAEGVVGRFTRPGLRQHVYQYIGSGKCSSHIHLKCEECGQLFHVDDDTMGEMMSLLQQSNKFNVDIKKTIVYGTCTGCDESVAESEGR